MLSSCVCGHDQNFTSMQYSAGSRLCRGVPASGRSRIHPQGFFTFPCSARSLAMSIWLARGRVSVLLHQRRQEPEQEHLTQRTQEHEHAIHFALLNRLKVRELIKPAHP